MRKKKFKIMQSTIKNTIEGRPSTEERYTGLKTFSIGQDTGMKQT